MKKETVERVIIWDWDGTIVDSIGYKNDGIWSEVFIDEPERQRIVRDFIKTPEGKKNTRYGLIRYTLMRTGVPEIEKFESNTLGEHPLIQKYGVRYRESLKGKILSLGLLPGVRGALEVLAERGYHMYVISAGGTSGDLGATAEELGIKSYFRKIFGFSESGASFGEINKRETFSAIKRMEGSFGSSHPLVIGDGETDRKLAEETGSQFIGVANEWNCWRADGKRIVSETADVLKLIT